MACSNCKCDPEPVKDFPASGAEVEDLKKSVYTLFEEVSAINKFLDHKFHNDLYHGGTCGYWAVEKKREQEDAKKLQETINYLKWRGYTIVEPGEVKSE